MEEGLLEYISEEMDTKFIEAVKKQTIHKEILEKENFKIVYSPLHGTGGRLIKRVFDETRFKFIEEKTREFEVEKYNATFLIGFEESYGYLVGTHARDKDAVVSTLLIVEMAAYYNSIGSSIPKELKKLYEKFGYYREGVIAITKKGKDGVEAISKIMSNLRANVLTLY